MIEKRDLTMGWFVVVVAILVAFTLGYYFGARW